MKLNNITQFLIFLVLVITCYIGIRSLNQHTNYYRISMRPYVIQYPKRGIEILDGYIRYTTCLTNKGKTPAYRVESYSTATFCDTFPIVMLIELLYEPLEPPKGIVFQGETSFAFPHEISVPKGNRRATKSEVIQAIKEGKLKIYVHTYVEFLDINKEEYFLRSSYLLENFKESERVCDCDWSMVNVLEEPVTIEDLND